MRAHLYKQRKVPGLLPPKQPWVLYLTLGPAINKDVVRIIEVSGKREARKLAEEHNAIPHNF